MVQNFVMIFSPKNFQITWRKYNQAKWCRGPFLLQKKIFNWMLIKAFSKVKGNLLKFFPQILVFFHTLFKISHETLNHCLQFFFTKNQKARNFWKLLRVPRKIFQIGDLIVIEDKTSWELCVDIVVEDLLFRLRHMIRIEDSIITTYKNDYFTLLLSGRIASQPYPDKKEDKTFTLIYID